MDKEVLEVVLKKSFDDSKMKRIIEMKVDSAMPKGENFLSTVLRITLKVVLGNGRVGKKSFIAKRENSGEFADQLKEEIKLFYTEVVVYNDILREMDYLMDEFGDTEGPLWCEFIHYSPSESIIILEDLKVSGFDTVDRTQPYDLDHARLVIWSLGRFHAMAKVLEDRGLISKNNYKPYMFIYDEVYVRNLIQGGLKTLAKGMKATWGEEWAEYADKLSRVPFEQILKKIKECGNFADNTFKCLNHGDCWSNNMMFKHDWEGRPIEMRFVDFQMPHYNSPTIDVANCLYRCLKPNVRHQHLQSLIDLYHESLTSSLDKFGYKGSKPSLDDINNDMERMSLFGMCFFTIFHPCCITERTDALNLDLIMKSNGDEGFNVSVYCEDGVKEKIGQDLKRVIKILES